MSEEKKEERRAYNVVLPVKLMQELTVVAVKSDKSRSELLEEIVSKHLKKIGV